MRTPRTTPVSRYFTSRSSYPRTAPTSNGEPDVQSSQIEFCAGKLDCPAPRFARPVRTARGGARRLGYLAWNPWENVTSGHS